MPSSLGPTDLPDHHPHQHRSSVLGSHRNVIGSESERRQHLSANDELGAG